MESLRDACGTNGNGTPYDCTGLEPTDTIVRCVLIMLCQNSIHMGIYHLL